MKRHKVLFLTPTAAEKQYLLEALRSLAGVLPYDYKIVQHSVGKAAAAYDAALELSEGSYSLAVSAGYCRSMNPNAQLGSLIAPSELIDIELAQHHCIFPDAGVAYKFDCIHKKPGVMLCSDQWLCTEEHYKDAYAVVGPEILHSASLGTECAAIAQAAEDSGCPFIVAKLLAAKASFSGTEDVSVYGAASDYLRNFDPVVHYVSDILANI